MRFNPARTHECQFWENETELNLMRYPESFMRSFRTPLGFNCVSRPRQFPFSTSTTPSRLAEIHNSREYLNSVLHCLQLVLIENFVVGLLRLVSRILMLLPLIISRHCAKLYPWKLNIQSCYCSHSRENFPTWWNNDANEMSLELVKSDCSVSGRILVISDF